MVGVDLSTPKPKGNVPMLVEFPLVNSQEPVAVNRERILFIQESHPGTKIHFGLEPKDHITVNEDYATVLAKLNAEGGDFTLPHLE